MAGWFQRCCRKVPPDSRAGDDSPASWGAVTAILETAEIDLAGTQALPQEHIAEGWARHINGHCSYKGYQALDCPHGSGPVQFWQLLLKNPGGKFHPVKPPPQCVPGGQPCTPTSVCCDFLTCCVGNRLRSGGTCVEACT